MCAVGRKGDAEKKILAHAVPFINRNIFFMGYLRGV